VPNPTRRAALKPTPRMSRHGAPRFAALSPAREYGFFGMLRIIPDDDAGSGRKLVKLLVSFAIESRCTHCISVGQDRRKADVVLPGAPIVIHEIFVSHANVPPNDLTVQDCTFGFRPIEAPE